MDNYKIYFYVIIFIIWLINQVRKGKEKLPAEAPNLPKPEIPKQVKSPSPLISQKKPARSIVTNSTTKKPVKYNDFFDDLDKASAEKTQIPVTKYQRNDYDYNLADEEKVIEQKIQRDKLEALRQKKQRVALADEHLQPYSLPNESSKSKFQELLNNPESLRDAMVLSEILNRKY